MTTMTSTLRNTADNGLRLLILLVCVGALLLAVEQRRDWQAAWLPEQPVLVSISGEYYRVPAQRVDMLRLLSELRFADGEAEAREMMRAHVHQGLDSLFADLSGRLPEFADWYYSLGGEYTRLSMLLLEKASIVDGDYMARRAQAIVFEGADFEGRLNNLRLQADSRLQQQAAATRAEWLADMLAVLARDRQPVAPLEPAESTSLDMLVHRLSGYGASEFTDRISMSGAAAVGAGAGSILWRVASRRAAATSGRALVARGAGRGVARAGVAAGGGAAICAPTGPGALGCAAVAGIAGWLATDWLLLRFEEAMNRGDLIAALQASLDELREEMEDDLLHAYDEVLDRQYSAMQADIQRTFVPLRSGQ